MQMNTEQCQAHSVHITHAFTIWFMQKRGSIVYYVEFICVLGVNDIN